MTSFIMTACIMSIQVLPRPIYIHFKDPIFGNNTNRVCNANTMSLQSITQYYNNILLECDWVFEATEQDMPLTRVFRRISVDAAVSITGAARLAKCPCFKDYTPSKYHLKCFSKLPDYSTISNIDFKCIVIQFRVYLF